MGLTKRQIEDEIDKKRKKAEQDQYNGYDQEILTIEEMNEIIEAENKK